MAASQGHKAFQSSAIASATEGAPEVTYDIDDLEVTFVTPDINQAVLATALIESASSDMKAGAALVNIFFGLIKPDEVPRDLDGEEIDLDEDEYSGPAFTDYTARRLQARMMNPRDPFGIAVMAEIMRSLLEEWSARPTQPSSPSSSSRAPAGSTSKATRRGGGSTRGASAR